ncbi:MAG: AsmA-like C-terminal domain-containing protein [Candidatus Devosia symbiotica]|nr:AsmA-like C-terminal domain-containing protein [Candidatus Devosia symbiotica]
MGIPALLSLLVYVVLLNTPIRLPMASEAAEAVASSILPSTSKLTLGLMALALENGVWPVIQFSPVLLTDSKTGARVTMDALEVGFSPMRALFGQPGTTVTVVKPHIQIVQDLFGPRLASFEIVDDPAGGTPTVLVQEGDDTFPAVDIGSSGIDLGETSEPVAMRSDNDWLIYNLEGCEQIIASLVEQAAQGRFSRLRIRDGIVGMNDSVYGLFRRFENINLDIGPSADLQDTQGTFSATLGARTMSGSLSRTLDVASNARLAADIANIDFAAFLPFIDDAGTLAALRGAGALSIDVNFDAPRGKLVDGDFKVDLTGIDLRLKDSYFPIASSIVDINWTPSSGQFSLEEAALQIGQSSARVAGTFVMGLDPAYGPTLGMALKARNVFIHPEDMAAPDVPFDSLEFSGWSAPLYGALGIDQLVARKGAAMVDVAGRVDMLQAGLGIDLTLTGAGVRADDMKRLWPYLMAPESRDWFVANVTAGIVKQARMVFKFPVGTIGQEDEGKAIPDGSIKIDLVGTGVDVKPTATMASIAIGGETRLQVDDADVTISADGGRLATAAGTIVVTNPAVIIDNSNLNDRIVEVSGDVAGAIPAMLDLVKTQRPALLANSELPVDITALTGMVDTGLVATIHLPDDASGRAMRFDYVLNGTIADFGSTIPIQSHSINNGQLTFSASQDGYQLNGTAEIDGIAARIEIGGMPSSDPEFRLSSTMDVAGMAKFGFDASAFLSGSVRFVARPRPDGTLQLAVDLKDAALDIKDLGISKAAGTTGSVSVSISQDGALTNLTGVNLAFGPIRAQGDIDYHTINGLVSAQFSQLALSEGDNAQLELQLIDGGYSVRVRGGQLDLKPMLKRFFGLNKDTGETQTNKTDQTIALDVKLDRALGFYATTAFGLDLAMQLRGSDVRQASLTGQFNEGNAVSVTTNPVPQGHTISVAFNDAGTILRFLGIYPQLAGGSGNLVLTSNRDNAVDTGQLMMREFAIVDEANVAQMLGNHSDSRAAISQQNRLDFDVAKVDFLRRPDRIEISNALMAGGAVGGTMRGFIYTKQRQYDLTGTYVPLFGINSMFQKIPLLGPLLGGRDGEGLLGVTFAVQGSLDKPEFKINPLSALVPGVLRELFEFRAKELP